MKKTLLLQVAIAALGFQGLAEAAWQASPPGMTEIIACGFNASKFTPIQWGSNWNSFSYSYFDSRTLGGDPYWNYAAHASTDICRNWVRGSVAGGAGYVAGQRSYPQGRTPHVTTYWYDYNWPNFYNQSQCGHQHLLTYVWGWRYTGSSWSIEFVSSTGQSTHWNASSQHCDFQGDGNPDYSPSFPGFAYGNGVVTINNSPYAVLYTAHQAQSHGGGPCGEFGCFHPLLAYLWY